VKPLLVAFGWKALQIRPFVTSEAADQLKKRESVGLIDCALRVLPQIVSKYKAIVEEKGCTVRALMLFDLCGVIVEHSIGGVLNVSADRRESMMKEVNELMIQLAAQLSDDSAADNQRQDELSHFWFAHLSRSRPKAEFLESNIARLLLELVAYALDHQCAS
jgi:hypothetical protein